MRLKSRDQKFSKMIRERDKVCVYCGWPEVECAHVFSRSSKSTRWDPGNAMALCRSCHRWYTDHPEEWKQFCISRMGEEAYYALKRKAKLEVM